MIIILHANKVRATVNIRRDLFLNRVFKIKSALFGLYEAHEKIIWLERLGEYGVLPRYLTDSSNSCAHRLLIMNVQLVISLVVCLIELNKGKKLSQKSL